MNAKTAPTAPRRSRRNLRWWQESLLVILVAVVLCAISLGGYVAFQLNRQLFPRFGLKPFDPAKAAQLTPEKRTAYEQELFSELSLWDKESRRYPERGEFVLREQRWQDMADDGFELAHITLRVLSPTELQTFALAGPVRRLEQLAEQGDTGAMCLINGLVSSAASQQKIAGYRTTRKKWLERGAELGNPECMTQLGGRLLLGADGYTQDVHRGLNMEFSARRMGYMHDVGALIFYYMGLGYDDPADVQRLYRGKRKSGTNIFAYRDLTDVKRLYCWLQIEQQSEIPIQERPPWVLGAPNQLLVNLQRESQRAHRPELAALHDGLQGKQYSLQDCVNFGTGEPTP